MSGQRKPGWYEGSPGEIAMTDQHRAGMIALVRRASILSVTAIDPEPDEDGDLDTSHHWILVDSDDPTDAAAFLSYVAVKHMQSVMACLGMTAEEAAALIVRAIEEGVGE